MGGTRGDISGLHEYVGNVHVHSNYSDGAASPQQIAAIANRRGLDFLILNDHDYMAKELHLEDEGFYGQLILLVGLEIGGRYHHYLAFRLKEMVRGKGLSPQEVIDRVRAQGGFGFLAHPFEKGMPFHEKSIAYTWNDLSVEGYTGICIWNFTSRWKERVKTAIHGLFCVAFKQYSLKGPSKETLAFWDAKNQERKVIAIGGSDAHGSGFKWGPISLVPISYDFALTSITIHVLLDRQLSGDFEEAKGQIYGAMEQGHLFIGHDNLAPTRGFRFFFEGQSGQMAIMGEELIFEPGILKVSTPLEGRIRIVRNGSLWAIGQGKGLEKEIAEPGVYRVEVYLRIPVFGWRPWIFSNPIFLR